METPKKQVKKQGTEKHLGASNISTQENTKTKSRFVDDEDDDLDLSLDDLGGYDNFDDLEDDDY
jgi:hypothetical protein